MKDTPSWLRAARDQWEFRGLKRPDFADEPGPNQESVWDFPRPPELRAHRGTLLVRRGGTVIAQTERGHLTCETASPPTYYFPRDDVDDACLREVRATSMCEWKGGASYYDVLGGVALPRAAWSYESPFVEFAEIRGHVAFMAAGLDCFVNDE